MPPSTPQTVFLLGNGRSGTRFLCGLFRNNAADCTAVHEPYLARSRPAMFGQAIYDLSHGRIDSLRQTWQRKLRGIRRCRTTWYVETSHAFLMSFADLAIEAFPDMKLVHVIRNPLHVCASQAARERAIHRWRMPLRNYRGPDGKTYFRWRFTGAEPIYQHFDFDRLTLFQKFFVQWIELENRAQQFLDRYQKRADCAVLHTPHELNDASKIRQMFDTLGLPTRRPEIALRGPQNRTPGRRHTIDDSLVAEMQQILERLPAEQLAIFERPLYSQFAWSAQLRGGRADTTREPTSGDSAPTRC